MPSLYTYKDSSPSLYTYKDSSPLLYTYKDSSPLLYNYDYTQSPAARGSLSSTGLFYFKIDYILWIFVPPVILVLGTFGNVMTVVVMRRMRSSQSTACLSVYFTALAVSDQFFLLTSVLWFWVDVRIGWPHSFFRYDLLCTIPWFVWYTCCLASVWILVAMTYQRVTSVVVPHRVGVLCTVRRGKVIVVVIVVLACVMNHHFLFTVSYWPQYRECLSREKYADFVDLFTWLDLFSASVLPFALLLVGNVVLVWHVIQSVRFAGKMPKTGEKQATVRVTKTSAMTTTLILTSAAFLVFTLPTCVFDTYFRTVDLTRVHRDFLAKIYLVETITMLLWFVNSASNFYIYLLSGSKFREETGRCLRSLFCLCRRGQ